MKNPKTALKWLLAMALIASSFGCSKKDNGANNPPAYGYGYDYGAYPGGVTPAGTVVVAAIARANMTSAPGLVEFELLFRSTGVLNANGGFGPVTVEGKVRMNTLDPLCGIYANPREVMEVIPAQSQVRIDGTSDVRVLNGRIAVRGAQGVYFIGFNQAQISPLSMGTAVGPITGTNGFTFNVHGSAQPGFCQAPNMNTDWPLQEI
jgi:hypothetical protein